MSSVPKHISFNQRRGLTATILGEAKATTHSQAVHAYSNEPKVHLEQVEEVLKIQSIPSHVTLETDVEVFGTSLNWAYRGYIVHHMSDVAVGRRRLRRPPLPITNGTEGDIHSGEIPENPALQPAVGLDGHLYLFNVLVALEWAPDQQDLETLMWAFRRASDFLYDVTDGAMAFGQVVFGGPELMACADIQIMSSNRLLPRSWVAGMHQPNKYMPIRVGRGLWNDRNRVSIPWDEPEAYRTLIHEWSHYALHLRDAYQSQHDLIPASAAGLGGKNNNATLLLRARPGEQSTIRAVIPSISLTSESIMATLEGTSELVHHTTDGSTVTTDDEWEAILATNHYPLLTSRERTLEGPGRMPLPLPIFGKASLTEGTQRFFLPPQGAQNSPLGALPASTRLDHTWVYVLRGLNTSAPTLIAQGTLDARLSHTAFRLLGAQPGDTVLLLAEQRNQPLVALQSTVTEDGSITAWQTNSVTFPRIDVIPDPASQGAQQASFKVRIQSAPGQALADRVWLFPIGQQGIDLGQPTTADWTGALPSNAKVQLDGYVLLKWGDQVLLAPFSQGGGPATHSPSPANPITAGSSDGSALLFFHDEAKARGETDVQDYSHIKLITTIQHNMEGTPPKAGAQPRSYAFSIAGNAKLPTELAPTLVIYFDTLDERELLQGDLRICRLENGKWKVLPTYLPPGYPFAVLPLDTRAAGSLLKEKAKQRVEYYRVFWVPR